MNAAGERPAYGSNASVPIAMPSEVVYSCGACGQANGIKVRSILICFWFQLTQLFDVSVFLNTIASGSYSMPWLWVSHII